WAKRWVRGKPRRRAAVPSLPSCPLVFHHFARSISPNLATISRSLRRWSRSINGVDIRGADRSRAPGPAPGRPPDGGPGSKPRSSPDRKALEAQCFCLIALAAGATGRPGRSVAHGAGELADQGGDALGRAGGRAGRHGVDEHRADDDAVRDGREPA